MDYEEKEKIANPVLVQCINSTKTNTFTYVKSDAYSISSDWFRGCMAA
jgi:hypothetical protein